MDLQAYLARIGIDDSPAVDFETLAKVHEHHLCAIPYENLDVQLEQPLDFDIERIFNKLVNQRRGGWCYEMNGLLGWALTEIGFEVTRMSGAVMRESLGDEQCGNHLLLEVKIDGEAYLADVGLGDGIRTPIPIRSATYTQHGMDYRLEHLTDGFWRLHNNPHSNVKSFDFRHEPADENQLRDKCHWLQTDPQSHFTNLLIAHRFDSDCIHVQVGLLYARLTAAGKTTQILESPTALQAQLSQVFGIDYDLQDAW